MPGYQWEFSTDNGASWNPVVTSTGGNTKQLNVLGAELQSGNKFRVGVTNADSCEEDISMEACLSIIDVACGTFPWGGN